MRFIIFTHYQFSLSMTIYPAINMTDMNPLDTYYPLSLSLGSFMWPQYSTYPFL